MLRFIYSLVYFTFALFLVLLGFLAILLAVSVTVRSEFVEFILANTLALSLFGFGFVLVGVAMLISLYFGAKRQNYYVKTNHQVAVVDEGLIQRYLDTYWSKVFPNQEIPTKLSIKKNKITVMADLPYVPPEERSACVQRIQSEIQDIFTSVLGYTDEFILSISFSRAPK